MTRPIRAFCATAALAVGVALLAMPAAAQVVIVGNDSKARVVDGALEVHPDAPQTVSVIDVSGLHPRLRATVDVPNSIFGPPTNLAVAPDGSIALVAEAVKPNAAGDGFEPSDKVHVLDLEGEPEVIDTVSVGRQPSGMSISPDGTLALVANRAESGLSVLAIDGKQVRFQGKVETSEPVTHVVFTPNGERALATNFTTHQVTLLDVNGIEVSETGTLPVGRYPYNADIAPDGSIALVANTGAGGRSDGNTDTVTVIDLQAEPPRVTDHVAVADAPEGIAISPTGNLAVTGNLDGGDAAPDAFWHADRSTVSVLSIRDGRVRHEEDVVVGQIAEALAFSAGGRFLLVGNLNNENVEVFRVAGHRLVPTGRAIDLPGHPGSMRGQP